MPTTESSPDEFLYGRREIGNDLAPEVFGVTIPTSRIHKLCSLGEGPPVDGVLGLKELTKRSNAVDWLRQLLSPEAKGPSLTARLTAKRDQRRKSTTSPST